MTDEYVKYINVGQLNGTYVPTNVTNKFTKSLAENNAASSMSSVGAETAGTPSVSGKGEASGLTRAPRAPNAPRAAPKAPKALRAAKAPKAASATADIASSAASGLTRASPATASLTASPATASSVPKANASTPQTFSPLFKISSSPSPNDTVAAPAALTAAALAFRPHQALNGTASSAFVGPEAALAFSPPQAVSSAPKQFGRTSFAGLGNGAGRGSLIPTNYNDLPLTYSKVSRKGGRRKHRTQKQKHSKNRTHSCKKKHQQKHSKKKHQQKRK